MGIKYIDAYVAFFPEVHGKILVAHHNTPQKQCMCWIVECRIRIYN